MAREYEIYRPTHCKRHYKWRSKKGLIAQACLRYAYEHLSNYIQLACHASLNLLSCTKELNPLGYQPQNKDLVH